MDSPSEYLRQAQEAEALRLAHISAANDAISKGVTSLRRLHRELAADQQKIADLCRKHADLLRKASPQTQEFMRRMWPNRTTITYPGVPGRGHEPS